MEGFDFPEPMNQLIQRLRKLPGVGTRSAERMALWLLQEGKEHASELSKAIVAAADGVVRCPVCGFFAANGECPACGAKGRDESLLCVVERATDVLHIERSGAFRGRFHVLGGRLSPLDNIGPEDLTIGALVGRVEQGGVSEVILALGSDVEGEATAGYLARLLSGSCAKVTRPAQGLPAGGGLEGADALTLSRALHGRRSLD